ncbi:MAG: sulfotransferase family 2 domain-containing protein [Acidimicrobiaceae bacterium]|nr:sulfotransferase family 2 domain-containing protein [Acidimicrobiaceae bacterium]MBT5578855.1 sulfotransferase family 2 domain-containing protein [Acidimicrobiaceae bacterium]MBT5850801.1 sulfotransferase family 2 domain-containing protein [Acidimicrobiaceae bacterium]
MISLHIPKTAGTSFRAALDVEYGNDLAHIYGGAAIDAHRYRAIHGHIRVDEARAVAGKAKWIMWLRDPVDRLASYYDFWRQSDPHGNPNHDHFLASDMGFATFIEWAPIRNEFAEHYVSGLEPDDFTFVGLTERYDDDIQRLAVTLGWRAAPTVSRANITPTRSTIITDDLRSHIAQFHPVETAWYDHFSD